MKQRLNNIYLLLKFYLKVVSLLKNSNIYNISIFNFKNWHHGYAYFYGFKENKKVFIKVDTKFLLLQNDLLVYQLANEKLKNYLLNIEDSIFSKNLQIIIYEFLDFTELSVDILENNRSIINTMLDMINTLNDLEIIHRDIKLDNFIFVNNELKIIDFTFAISNNKALGFKDLERNINNCATLEFLGDGLNPEPFVWNDYYALSRLFNLQLDRLDVNSKIQTFKINCPKIYFKIRNIKIIIKKLLGIDITYRELKNG